MNEKRLISPSWVFHNPKENTVNITPRAPVASKSHRVCILLLHRFFRGRTWLDAAFVHFVALRFAVGESMIDREERMDRHPPRRDRFALNRCLPHPIRETYIYIWKTRTRSGWRDIPPADLSHRVSFRDMLVKRHIVAVKCRATCITVSLNFPGMKRDISRATAWISTPRFDRSAEICRVKLLFRTFPPRKFVQLWQLWIIKIINTSAHCVSVNVVMWKLQ